MKETDIAIVNFCRMLAKIRKLFRETHIYAEKQPCFNGVTTTVSHSEKDIITVDERLPAVEISFSVDGELNEIIDKEKYSLGASIAIYYVQDEWRVEGDVGWSCVESGWDDYESFEMVAMNSIELENEIERFVNQTLNSYKSAIAEHFVA
ncbi:MAG: hypothetical protein PVG39_08715 [Desulfobacteraceae bacterium]|jgi:hypothetical protein